MFGAENRSAHVGDSLDGHARDVQVGAVGAGLAQEAVDVYFFEAGYVPECDWAPEQW